MLKDYIKIYKQLEAKNNNHSHDEIKSKKERALAIKRLGGMEALYEKHLAKFKIQYAKSSDMIKEFITSGQFEEAHRFAHSVKGLAGTLGLFDIQQKAAELEQSIKEGDASKITADIEAFVPAMEQICKE